MTRKKAPVPTLRARLYADAGDDLVGDEGYLIGLLTLTWQAPAKGRTVSAATWYHATLAKILMERYGATQKQAILTVIREPTDALAYGRIERALQQLKLGKGHAKTIPEPIIERAAKLL